MESSNIYWHLHQQEEEQNITGILKRPKGCNKNVEKKVRFKNIQKNLLKRPP